MKLFAISSNIEKNKTLAKNGSIESFNKNETDFCLMSIPNQTLDLDRKYKILLNKISRDNKNCLIADRLRSGTSSKY